VSAYPTTLKTGEYEGAKAAQLALPLDRWGLPTVANPMAAVDWTAEFCQTATTGIGSAALVALGLSLRLDRIPNHLTPGDAEDSRTLIGSRLGPMVRAPYFWSPELCDLVYRLAPELPPYTLTRDAPPSPWGIFWYGKPQATAHGGAPALLRGLGWAMAQGIGAAPGGGFYVTPDLTPRPGGDYYIDVFEFLAVRFEAKTLPAMLYGGELLKMGTFPAACGAWGVGDTYDEAGWVKKYDPDLWMATPAEARTRAQILATSFLLLKQRVVVPERRPTDRTTGRRWANKAHPAGIASVTLRHAAPREKGEKRPVDWTHRWWVSAHWRNYRVGKGRERSEPRFISPFVKGPADRPLLAQPERLFKVVR